MRYLKHIVLFTFVLFNGIYTFAQQNDSEVYTNFEKNYNELLQTYYMQSNEKIQNQRFAGTTYKNEKASDVSDTVYQQRLKSIPSCVKLVYNPIVRNHIIYYVDRIGDRVGVMLGLSKYYFPIFEDILDSYGVPSELKYLVIIESAFNPTAVSKAGATGLWQFMYATGRIYDLRVNSVVDDRRDPIKSTVAAAKYLKDLYAMYGDWSLVLAAYNCGPGNVNKAIKRSGGKNDFWEIYPYLPKETRNYVPAYIAATYVMNYHNEHGIYPVELTKPLDLITDTVIVSKDIYFGQVEKVINIPKQQLKELNPQYKMDYIPGTQGEYSLKLPLAYIETFIEMEDSISNTDKQLYYPELYGYNSADSSGETVYVTKTIYHKVQRKDSWSSVARKYGVSVADLRKWNRKIKTNSLKRGTLLAIEQKVAVEKKNYIKQESADTNSVSENNIVAADNANNQQEATGNISKQNSNTKKETKQNTAKQTQTKQAVYHTVKNGDTIGKIAAKYKVSVAQILKNNKLTQESAKKIRPGQKLKIK